MCVCVCSYACVCVYWELVGQWEEVRGQHASVCAPAGMGYECAKGGVGGSGVGRVIHFLHYQDQNLDCNFFIASRECSSFIYPTLFALLLLAYQVIACEVERFRYLLFRSLSAALVVEPESGKELGGKTQQYERAGGREGGKEGGS